MALLECETRIDERGREIQPHAASLFPLSCYQDDFARARVPWHWHDELEAALVVEGVARVELQGASFCVPAGGGYFIGAGALHAMRGEGGAPCRQRSLTFLPQLVGGEGSVYWQKYLLPLMRNLGAGGLPLTQGSPWQARAIAAIADAWSAGVAEGPGYEFEARAALSRLCHLLYANVVAPVRGGAASRRNAERLKRMMRFMQENLSGALSLSQIAASAAVSERECLRCFHEVIGVPPMRYLRQLRLERAARLLSTTEMTVAEVGSDCGFSEPSLFIRSFRSRYGQTPAAYRRAGGEATGGGAR